MTSVSALAGGGQHDGVGGEPLPGGQRDLAGTGRGGVRVDHLTTRQQPVVGKEDVAGPVRAYQCPQGPGGVHERVLRLDEDDVGVGVERLGHRGAPIATADDHHAIRHVFRPISTMKFAQRTILVRVTNFIRT